MNVERGFFQMTRAKPRTPARRMVPILPALAEWIRHTCKVGPICTNLRTRPGARHGAAAPGCDW